MSKIKWVVLEQEPLISPFGFQEVILKLNDGNIYGCKVDHPRGEPQNPQTYQEFATKFRDYALYAHYDEKTVSRIQDLIMNLENIEDVSQLTALIGE
jgi:2-methylcitrate dehydratase PrpD